MLAVSRRTALVLLLVGAVAALGLAAAVVVPRVQLERAKNPGLGVRGLHARGVTGAGVAVGIIDGQMRRDHEEFAERLVHYEELDDFSGLPFDMHGPAMASLLVGRSIGVAPGATLHHFALDFARVTPQRLAEAIDHVVDRNGALPPEERVRVLSVSIGFRGEDRAVVDAAARRAIERDVFVLMSVFPLEYLEPPLAIRGLGCSPWRNCDRPEPFGFSPGEAAFWRSEGESVADVLARRLASDAELGYVTLYAPAHHRTVAGHRDARQYRYDVEGGDSEWPPYLSGVLALALQVAPELHAADLAGLLGAARHENGVIAPARVVEHAQAQGLAGAAVGTVAGAVSETLRKGAPRGE
jgi:subtilisin family serine protease